MERYLSTVNVIFAVVTRDNRRRLRAFQIKPGATQPKNSPGLWVLGINGTDNQVRRGTVPDPFSMVACVWRCITATVPLAFVAIRDNLNRRPGAF